MFILRYAGLFPPVAMGTLLLLPWSPCSPVVWAKWKKLMSRILCMYVTVLCCIIQYCTVLYRNARKKCEYFNSANCARCFPLALFWCALIRLLHLHMCLALAVVAQIKIAHDVQMINFVQIAQYYSRTFF